MSGSVQKAAADERQRAGGSCRYAAACRWQLWMSSMHEAAADEPAVVVTATLVNSEAARVMAASADELAVMGTAALVVGGCAVQ